MQNGWIKLHRKIQDNGLYADSNMLKLWIHCLLKASHKERTQLIGNQMVELKPGEFVTGRESLAEEFNRGVSKAKVVSAITLWRWLNNFEKWGMLNIKKTTKYSVVTITNWSEHQQDEQQVNNKRTTDEQQVNTNKNVKNDKNEKKKESVSKKQYSELVFMTEEEYSRLVEEFGESIIRSKIEDLDNYIGSTGKKYKDHNRTIRSWLKRDKVVGGQVASKPKPFVRVLEDG